MKKLITGILLSGMLIVSSSLVANAATCKQHSYTMLARTPYTQVVSSNTHYYGNKKCTKKVVRTVIPLMCKCGATKNTYANSYVTHSINHP